MFTSHPFCSRRLGSFPVLRKTTTLRAKQQRMYNTYGVPPAGKPSPLQQPVHTHAGQHTRMPSRYPSILLEYCALREFGCLPPVRELSVRVPPFVALHRTNPTNTKPPRHPLVEHLRCVRLRPLTELQESCKQHIRCRSSFHGRLFCPRSSKRYESFANCCFVKIHWCVGALGNATLRNLHCFQHGMSRMAPVLVKLILSGSSESVWVLLSRSMGLASSPGCSERSSEPRQ